MKKMMNIAIAAAVAALSCSVAIAQNGLAGELDDLLGLGEEAPAPAAAEEAKEAAAEVKEDVAEAAPAAEEAKAAVEDALAPVEEAAAEVKEEAAEAAPAAAEEAKAAVDDALAPVEEAAAEVKEEAAEAAPAAAEEAKAAVDEALAPVEDAVEAKEEPVAAEPAEDVAEEAVEEGTEGEAASSEEPAASAEESAEAAPADEPAPAEAAVTDDIAAEISEIESLERMRRKALDEHGKTSLASAQEEMKNGNYVEAQRLFEEADKFITRRPGNEELVSAAAAGISEAIYRQAEVLYKRGDLDGALQLARQAREHNHKKAVDLIGRIQHDIDNPPEEKVVREAKRWNDRDYRKNQDQIRARLSRARQYYITGEFDRARLELEKILKDNPYEHDAMVMLKRVADRTYDIDTVELNATRSTMIEAVRKAWTPDRYAIDVSDLDAESDGVGTEGKPINIAGMTPEEETQEKMKKIVIPEINFKNASISDVIEFFVDASREFDDPNIAPEQRGVNLILKIQATAAAEAEIDEDDPFAAPAASSDNGVPPVTFSARFMSLWEGLQYACELSKLKFRIRGNTVMIMPQNEADVDMTSRTYTVLPSIEERASSMSTELSSRSQDDEGRAMFGSDEDSGASSSGGVDWKQLFEDMGVKWPNGSSVKYLPSINKMRVLNTPENLVEFEKALQELNVTPRQVEIEARFVEVAQTDLESLGFEWLLTDNWEIAKNKGDNSQYIRVNKGAGTSSALRHVNNDGSIPFLGLSKSVGDYGISDSLLSVNSVLTNPELGFVLHALSQQANTDLLSAPKVVTMNGEEAIIKVVKEYIYPTEYEIVENDMDSSSDSDTIEVSYPSVEPSEFEMREVGVILQVVPQVSDDGQMISLQLNPQIISDPEWKDYGFDYPIRMTGENFETLHLKMEQPIFKVRSVSTKISIYNGATVVMGGMITEERNEVNDKIPLLGDIPLLGRLFRSTYESSEKRNLLIFVTARMVDPAGRTLKTNASEGPVVQSGK